METFLESPPVGGLEVLGVSFRTAPAAVREALSFDTAAVAVLLRMVAEEMPGCEALVLSTCNRTEFYLVPPPGMPAAVESFLGLLRRRRPEAPILRADCPRYRLTGREAMQHLLRVASGLDSQIIGDGQILGQVRAAVATARAAGTVGAVLERAARHAMRAGKRARCETALGQGSASIGAAIASMVATHDPRMVLVIGAGEVGCEVGRHLAKQGVERLCIVNRTLAGAVALAEDCGGEAHPWEALVELLSAADVVVAATSSAAPILGAALLDQVLARRLGRALTVIDAGMPRNVVAGAGVTVVDVDGIREHRTAVLEARRAAVPAVERILTEELEVYEHWRATRVTDSTIQALYGRAAAVSIEAAGMLAGEPRDPEDIARVFLRSFKRVMHDHVKALRGRPAMAPTFIGAAR